MISINNNIKVSDEIELPENYPKGITSLAEKAKITNEELNEIFNENYIKEKENGCPAEELSDQAVGNIFGDLSKETTTDEDKERNKAELKRIEEYIESGQYEIDQQKAYHNRTDAEIIADIESDPEYIMVKNAQKEISKVITEYDDWIESNQQEVLHKIGRIENDLDTCQYESESDYIKSTEENQSESDDTNSKGLHFNGQRVIGYPDEVNMFCQSLPDGDLFLSHYKSVDGFCTLWYLKNKETTKKTRIVESKKSLASTNKRIDNELIRMAREKYGIDGQKHLDNAGDFISDNYEKFFPEKQKSTVPRSKKDSYLIGIAEYLDKKFKITIHKLTGRLHIYNKTSGIYKSYNETEFSGFLKNEYGQTFLKDEVIKIMGTFSNIKEESEDYIAFKNCLLNLETLKTREFTSHEFVVFQVPFNWNPEAKSKFFEGKLREILVDAQRFEQFLKLNGYNFTKDNPHNLITLLIGEGSNGKTTLMDLIRIIFHNSVASVGLHQFENEFGLQPLLGKRINTFPDIKKITLKDIGMLKAVTGEDEITVNRKYKDPITTKLACKVIGAGNHLPRIEEDTLAVWRRINIIELTNTFTDTTIKKRLLNDTEGIEWLIYESIQAYKKVKLSGASMQKPASAVRKEYLRVSDPCRYAAEELFEKTNEPEDYVTREEIVKMISDFLKANELNKPKHNGTYYTAIRAMGGEEIEKTINSETVRSFCYIKPKELIRGKDTDQLESLALNGDEEAQAELESRTLIENISNEESIDGDTGD